LDINKKKAQITQGFKKMSEREKVVGDDRFELPTLSV
jgi:hypothetical protein